MNAPQAAKPPSRLLFEGSEWTFEKIDRVYDAIEVIAHDDLGLDVYPNQIEIITSEQMLDAYSSNGLPLIYQHWSFGKRFVRDEALYRKGHQSLAYEIVINSKPCISYYMEENTMAMQTLVIAHAAFGHNHFFKNNYLFREWTDASAILDYLDFAKTYIANCEERHGYAAVEEVLDAAHALMDQGVFRYRRPSKMSADARRVRQKERDAYEEQNFNDLWRTLPGVDKPDDDEVAAALAEANKHLTLPDENLLYFIEKNSPSLKTWQREILRIVRSMAQYFYPQKQTKVMNEGCACFVHYYIFNELYEQGMITEGALLEMLHSHSNVVFQPGFDDRRYGGINPYALGFAMMQDIKRICIEPTDEDRDWFPEFAGSGDWRGVLKHAWANYRDESFVRQFLSPHLMREMRLFVLGDKAGQSHFVVDNIHNERGYREVREAVARSYDITLIEPDIQAVGYDHQGDRSLSLQYVGREGTPLAEQSRDDVLTYVRRLWGYDVHLEGVDLESGDTIFDAKA